MAQRHPVRAAGNLITSGSTRYSSKGSRKSHPKLKTYGSIAGGGFAGAAIGGVLGSVGGSQAAAVGAQIGNVAGGLAGRRFAVHQGYTHRTKQRMSLRAVGSKYGRAETFHHGPHGQAQLQAGHFQNSLAHHGIR